MYNEISKNGESQVLSVTLNVNVSESANQMSTQLPPIHRPLKRPQIMITATPTMSNDSKYPLKVVPMKEVEYLLEREDAQPIPYSINNYQNMRSYPQPGHVTTEVITPTIRNQIPRPPDFKKMPTWRRQIDYDDEDQPRPFNYIPQNFGAHELQKCNCSEDLARTMGKPVNNIQDILRQTTSSEGREDESAAGIKIAGRYRHPRGKGMGNMIKRLMRRRNNWVQATKLNSQYYPDPLNSYKPRSPGEVNMLAVNQFKFMRPSGHWKVNRGKQYYKPEVENFGESLYQQIIATNESRQRQQRNSRISTSEPNHKPFSLMLDIYPMNENERPSQTTNQRPYRVKPRRPYFALPPGPRAVNNLPYSYPLDNSYYNSLQFSQLQHQKYPQPPQFHENLVLNNQEEQIFPQIPNKVRKPEDNSPNNPSQIMVHLNLYPKKKPRQHQINSDNYLSRSYALNETIAKMDTQLVAKAVKPSFSTESPLYNRGTTNPSEAFFNFQSARGNQGNGSVRNSPNPGEGAVHNKHSFQVPKESMIKFQYNDALTIGPDPI
ncbi:unnamed protein product [Hermetia illucens]|nr:unnamed protein product [Hermetia illucens]